MGLAGASLKAECLSNLRDNSPPRPQRQRLSSMFIIGKRELSIETLVPDREFEVAKEWMAKEKQRTRGTLIAALVI